MSQVKISGNASGTGVFTVASPNSNNTQTLTLPDATGTLVNTADSNLVTLAAASASDMTGVNTTATVTSGTTSMTVGSGTGIIAGMWVVAQGITPGTTVSTVVGTTVTLSANAGATLSAAPVTFYSSAKILTPATVGGQLCRAWVTFNPSSGTPVIQASFNVSSVTRTSTGQYTVTFTNSLSDGKYAALATENGSTAGYGMATSPNWNGTNTASSAIVATLSNTNFVDPQWVSFAAFR